MFQPGSEFSKIILGAHNYFRNANSDTYPEKSRVLSVLEQYDMMLGVTAHPGLSSTDERRACVLGLANALDGLIFDGYAMLDDTGTIILSPDADFRTWNRNGTYVYQLRASGVTAGSRWREAGLA